MFSLQAITGTLIPDSLLPQIRDLWLGESSPSGSHGVPGGRIEGVEGGRGRKRENRRDSLRLLSTDCMLVISKIGDHFRRLRKAWRFGYYCSVGPRD
jgi:hypothetical protein